MDVLIHPTYFPSIAHFVAMVQADQILFEVYDNYQKQTFRNRTSIYGANGKLDLNVPVVYSQKNRQLYAEVNIFSNAEDWQSQHLKSLESAYRTSPFFEFYIDDLLPLFELNTSSIMEFNFQCIEQLFDSLQLPFTYLKTEHFEVNPNGVLDARILANSRKKVKQEFQKYPQVFDDKHGFIGNLSILDLLFNEGPNAELYLRDQTLKL